MDQNLKLYVWEDVLHDYTAGMVCILAESLEQALELAREKESDWVEEFGGKPYQVVTEPAAFMVHGGS